MGKASSKMTQKRSNGIGVPENRVIAYALYNLSSKNEQAKNDLAACNRIALAQKMTIREIKVAEALTKKITVSGNLQTELLQYEKHPAVIVATIASSSKESKFHDTNATRSNQLAQCD